MGLIPDVPDATTLSVLALAALAGGLTRGFTGFGFAMVFMPLAGTVVPMPFAFALIWLIDMPVGLLFAARSARQAQVREVAPLLAGVTAGLPLGLWLLLSLDPIVLRWLVCGVIGVAVAALASGWRWRGRPGLPLSLSVGGLSGLASGFASLGGLPIAIFWLSAQATSALQMRHNLALFFGGTTVLSGLLTAWAGLFSLAHVAVAVPLAALYALGAFAGSRGFHLAPESTFRRVAYGVIAFSALVSLPLWDGLIAR